MRRRSTRLWVGTVLVATLLIPAVGSVAGPRDELSKTQDKLEQLRAEIDVHSAQARSDEAAIDALSRDITELQIAINSLNAEIAEIEVQVRSAQARIDATQAEIDRVQDIAVEQAVDLYKAGEADGLDVLLESESFTELENRLEMLGVAAERNTGAIIKLGRLTARIEAQQRELFEAKEILDTQLQARSELQASLEAKRTDIAARLAKLRAELGAERDREGDLEAHARDLTQKIQAAQARQAVENFGTSDQGFIWPLNGGITSGYGPRWGRMHTGLDIDGYTGQPVVASKSGRVVMASSYSGYGYAVVIDHGGGISTLYAHLSGFNTSSGRSIGQGDVLGYVGCTGSCTGDHVHFEVRVNGSPVNPMSYLP